MKKSIKAKLVLLTTLFLTWNVAAQNSIGGKLGVNFASWNSDEAFTEGSDQKYMTGTNLGLAFQIGVSDMLSIQPELLLIQKGVRVEEFDSRVSSKLLFKLNYLEVPMLVKLSFPVSESLGLFVNAGPSIGYALNGKIIYIEDGDRKEDIDFDDDDGFKRTDISMVLGGGASFNLSSVKLLLEARYLYGFSNVLDIEAEDFTRKNRGVGITAGIMVPL
jgi:opacity protein-like surface antigen